VTSAVTETKYVAPAGYVARHDADFVDVVVGHLIRHQGEWCKLGQVFSCDVWEARDAVMVARRLGLVVLGDRTKGYRLVGFSRPRYVHLRAAAAWPPEDLPEQDPGQLTFIDDEAIE